MNWKDIEYLSSGNERQQKAYHVLKKTNVLSVLQEYDPILVGTIPIGIDIKDSDLDIICNTRDLKGFQKIVAENFSQYKPFAGYFKEDAFVASFRYDGTEIEIYAKDKPSFLQNGYRHMLIEHRILNMAGEKFREEIIGLKNKATKQNLHSGNY